MSPLPLQLPAPSTPAATRLVEEWVTRELAVDLENALALAVHEGEPWRALYRSALCGAVRGPVGRDGQVRAPVRLLRAPVGLAAFAPTVQVSRLPHRGPLARLTISSEEGGVVVRAGSATASATPEAGAVTLVIDDLAGEVCIPFEAAQPTRAELLQLLARAFSDGDSAQLAAGFTAFREVAAPVLQRASSRLTERSRAGNDEQDDDLAEAVSLVLRARLALESVPLPDGLAPALEALDSALWPHRRGVLLTSADGYFDALREHVEPSALVTPTWWSYRALSASNVPPGRLDTALARLSREDSQLRAKQAAHSSAALLRSLLARDAAELARFRSERVALIEPTRQAPARAASAESTRAGRVRVPIVLEDGRGALIHLTVRVREPGDATPQWARAGALRPVALDACRAAYFAACRLVPGGAPPASFDMHAFDLEGEAAPRALDGASLGAAAVGAFVSAWIGQPLSEGVAVSSVVRPDLERGDVFLSVGGLESKLRACVGQRLLIAERQLAEARTLAAPLGVEVVGIATPRALLDALGLTLPATPTWKPWLGDVATRLRDLLAMSHDVETQTTTPYQSSDSTPWLVLADRMRATIESLPKLGRAERDAVATARAWCANAYQHAAEPELSRAVLAGTELPDTAPIALRAQHACVALSGAIQVEIAPDAASLDASLAALEPGLGESDTELRGAIAGTRGRLRMHQRLLDAETLGFLETAVQLHDAEAPEQAPRSRIYLAMTLRMMGRAPEALDALMSAHEGIARELVGKWDHYAQSTSVFLEYELARTLLSLGRPADAITLAQHADVCAAAMGWSWPRHGILRTLVWAQREVGEDTRPALEALERLAPLAGFVEEASGPMREDGIVY